MQESKCNISSLEVEQLVSTINPVFVGTTSKNIDEMIKKQIVNIRTEYSFFVIDIGVVLRLWKTWKLSMPHVHLFYAVKCNSDRVLLALLSALGAGFDVASKAEHDMVRDLGIGAVRIIFANPCKMPSHILHAAKHDVHLTTFDSEAELYKLHKVNPQAEVFLRIRVCDSGASCPLGVEYGVEMEESLLPEVLGLKVVDVAFHAGSGALDPLDIGAGFVSDGGHGASVSAAAASINDALEKFFLACMGIMVIAEPGRFFAGVIYSGSPSFWKSYVQKEWTGSGDHAILSVRALSACSKEDFMVVDEGCEYNLCSHM